MNRASARAFSAALLFALLLSAAPARAQYQLTAGRRVLLDGDSISSAYIYGNDFANYGWYVPALNTINPQYLKLAHPVSTSVASSSTKVTSAVQTSPLNGLQDFRPVIQNVAVAGTTMASRAANIGATLASLNQTTDVWLEVGVNDVTAAYGFGPGFLTAFRANADSYWATVTSLCPTCKKVAVGIFCWGEAYPDLTTSDLPGANAAIKASVEAAGGVYMDMRAAWTAWESVNNVPPPGVNFGLLTQDGTHPLIGTGSVIMSNKFLSNTVLSGFPQ